MHQIRQVFFVLKNQDIELSAPMSEFVSASISVFEFKQAIWSKCKQRMIEMSPSDLSVYPCLDSKVPLGNADQIDPCFGRSEEAPLIVFVPLLELDSGSIEDALDLVVVGAGPHALSLICHILESSPFDILSDSDHSRLHHLNKNANNHPLYSCCPSLDINACRKRIQVIDGEGTWMQKWNNSFHAYEIKHLRSPIFFHPDPFDPNALRSFAETENRLCELHDITHIVDECKKCNKKGKKGNGNLKENDRNQFYTPSQSLFSDFCNSLVDRYFLSDLVIQGWVQDILPVEKDSKSTIFKIRYKKSIVSYGENACCSKTVEKVILKEVYAKTVVCALGNANIPQFPAFVMNLPDKTYPSSRLVHSTELASRIKVPIPRDLIVKTNLKLLVIGGGLTSAQLVHLGMEKGFKDIILATRSKIKTKPFDVPIEWVGRNSTRMHYDFWQQDPVNRQKLLRQAKAGGSITPHYTTLLRDLEKAKILQIREGCTVSSATWSSNRWNVSFSKDPNIVEYFDMIWLGTGCVMDITRELCMASVLEHSPTRIIAGLPLLDDDLKWPDLNLYIMSGYSGLSIGPSASNLFGGRVGAQKISRKIWQLWQAELGTTDDENGGKIIEKIPDLRTLATMSGSFVNYWDALAIA